ncbi:glutamate-5-semialdehyde dehydrogenase [Candidatus Woesearchaeota archaeon]|nr:glutamate-5-semialdehyde dehydrogenase [Candidatus Woesearchaeota archaeon]|tara:strand:- start:237 stop:1520 length:1284 start_codon:yes stop_codon:yes gene_type:complete
MSIEKQAQLAKDASLKLAVLSTKAKNRALKAIAKALKNNSKLILNANKRDVEAAKKAKLNYVLVNRLMLNKHKINEMIEEVKSVTKLEDPVGKVLSQIELDKGLNLYQVTCPIGVIGMIFESRPDVVSQISALCLKSGNSVILKGGSEAKNSNRILVNIISRAAERNGITKGSIQLIETREQVTQMLKLDEYVSLVIPRGSNSFVKYVQEHTKIPVLGHSEGICHLFIDKNANLRKAIGISFDAKCQYPAVCNAIETLLVHKDIAKKFLPKVIKKLKQAKVEIRGDEKTRKIVKEISKAAEKDWSTEYNDLILSIKVVNDLNEAINHINRYGSGHTDGIVTENKQNANIFMDLVDSSSVMWNASTRFADGFRYGKGAEVGISTSKIHSRGPVGLEGLVIYKYKLIGKGQIVKNYSGKNARKFKHKVK